MEFGGIDLESYRLTSIGQVQSVLAQVLSSMSLAEERLLFEHRDLHLGNVLIRSTHRADIRLGNYQTIQTEGILCCIIDCSLARFRDRNGSVEYRDLVEDDWLFTGDSTESGQYQVYRDMRDIVDDCWNQFHPKTNLLWISFMATELLNKFGKDVKKEQYTRLRTFANNLTTYKDYGKYFFHDTVEGCSKYQPPEHLLEYLLELAPEKLDSLFDPDKEYILDGETFQTEYLSEEDYIVPSDEDTVLDEMAPRDGSGGLNEMTPREESTMLDKMAPRDESTAFDEMSPRDKEIQDPTSQARQIERPVKTLVKKLNAEEHQAAVENYNQMLMDSNIDPFQSWDIISNKLSSDPRFSGISNAKERRSLFDAACPALAEGTRERRRQRLEAAEDAWKAALEGLTLATAPTTWTEYSRHIRQEEWFRLLDSKKMEREYRDRLRDLVDRSRVYQIPR
ncbi:hypothetical protein PSACC_02673 [Paramicrosporidium saccamoebae]|uniref:non-specific serine/threonine protein kinase n=1 Tax=Paramicrosporidium saccamoebae TaxID=1246581 RepID=A0A2H9TII9_9FUNG|nr:hypothetical protein PSACC_02673 [Paramicrosporidium saccamoebae]